MTITNSNVLRRIGRAILACLIGTAAMGIASPASAQNYPHKPIRFIVPYPPGGGTDIVARLIAAKMQQKFGHPVLVENKAGASTVIGTDAVAQAAPDGYTIGLITDSHVLNPYFLPNLPYDSTKDFQPVSQLAFITLMLVANPSLEVKSLQELIALAKSKPGKLTYASIGKGTPHHMAMEWLNSMAGIELLHVPYRGVAPALTDLVGGQVDVMFTGTSSAKPFVDNKKLIPLAVSSAKRQEAFPDTPSVAEAGLPDYDLVTWYGVVAPAGTPPEIVARLNEGIADALNQQDVKERLITLGVAGAASTPEEFGNFMKHESKKFAGIIQKAGVKAD